VETNSTQQYFYKLGHQKDLGLAEFAFLSKDKDFSFDSNWLFSNSLIKVKETGSLIYSGKVIQSWSKDDYRDRLLLDALEKFLKSPEISFKKLGLVLPKDLHPQALEISKKNGVKKINLLSLGELPNYGHWKQAKNWIILYVFKDQIVLGHILQYVDQQFWAILDSSLPKGDISRGLINLKLARTLLNFSEKDIVWDPFAGHARVLAAGLDLKKEFYLSDIEGGELGQEMKENYNYASQFWERNNIEKSNLGELKEVFDLDASELKKATFLSEIDPKTISIVTEGCLGKNFKYLPGKDEIKREWDSLEIIWRSLIREAFELKIPEIIFCLPFYKLKNETMIPVFLKELVYETEYKYSKLFNTDYLKYSRPNSIVGHFILKLELNS